MESLKLSTGKKERNSPGQTAVKRLMCNHQDHHYNCSLCVDMSDQDCNFRERSLERGQVEGRRGWVGENSNSKTLELENFILQGL